MGIHSLYPGASKEELDQMRGIYTLFKEDEDAFVSARVKYMEDNIPYVDIYIWDNRLEMGYMRLVISEQFYWSEEEEANFRHYLYFNSYMLKMEYDILYEKAREAYPEIHLKQYDYNKTELLAHIYYATHWKYPEEKLYKAGLSSIALYLRSLSDYDDEGNTPSEILGLPMNLLKSLNYRENVKLLLTKEKRYRLLQVYRKYQKLFDAKGKILSNGQILFLQDLAEGETLCKESEIDEVFNFVGRYDDAWEYRGYKKYLELRKEVEKYLKLPLCSDFADEVSADEKKDMILEYVENKEYINRMLCEMQKEYAEKYEFEDEIYCLRLPRSLDDLMIESTTLSNCLWRYVPDLLNKQTTVLFLRKQSDVDTPYAAIEITNNGDIIQARAKYNHSVKDEVKDWLWKYAQKKGFSCYYIMDDDDEWEWD